MPARQHLQINMAKDNNLGYIVLAVVAIVALYFVSPYSQGYYVTNEGSGGSSGGTTSPPPYLDRDISIRGWAVYDWGSRTFIDLPGKIYGEQIASYVVTSDKTPYTSCIISSNNPNPPCKGNYIAVRNSNGVYDISYEFPQKVTLCAKWITTDLSAALSEEFCPANNVAGITVVNRHNGASTFNIYGYGVVNGHAISLSAINSAPSSKAGMTDYWATFKIGREGRHPGIDVSSAKVSSATPPSTANNLWADLIYGNIKCQVRFTSTTGLDIGTNGIQPYNCDANADFLYRTIGTTYTLSAGQSVTVGDVQWKVNSISQTSSGLAASVSARLGSLSPETKTVSPYGRYTFLTSNLKTISTVYVEDITTSAVKLRVGTAPVDIHKITMVATTQSGKKYTFVNNLVVNWRLPWVAFEALSYTGIRI